MQPGSATAIVLFAHGAKDPEWAQPMERIQSAVRLLLPGTPVALAYLERMRPTLSEAVSAVIDEGARSVTVVPLFLAAGGHIKQDLPELIGELQRRHPDVRIAATTPLGDDADVLDAIAAWVVRKHRAA